MSGDRRDVDPLEETRAESIRPGKLVAGAPIGGYHLLSVLGEGGMGVVWSAQDPMLDRLVAIKVLKRSDAAPSLRMRLLREARAMARLKHPNVLTVYEVGTEGDRDFIAMELVEGGPLDEWLGRDPPRADVIAALLAAGRGLAAAHAAGLVHRDFKPNNVLRSKAGRVLVTDFGLARGLADEPLPVEPGDAAPVAVDLGSRADSVLHSPLTKTGAMIGTPAYMAPEQYAGAAPDPRTDQFAFCVTAWQALTGARPYHGRTLEELRAAASGGVAHVVTDLPRPVRDVLARGLDPEPAKRWPDLDSLLAAFEQATRARPRKRWPIVAAGAGGIAIVASVLVVGLGGSKPEPPVCEPADAVFANADAQVRLPTEHAAIGAAFVEHRRRWFVDYEQTCKEPKPARARVACLRAIRDRTAAMGELVARAPAGFDASLLLPHPAACSARTPVAPPNPDDAERAAVLAVYAKLMALDATQNLAKLTAEIETEARAIGWAPLMPTVQVAAGREYIRRGDVGRAREVLARAIPNAESGDPRLAAIARLAMLEAALVELEHPSDFSNTKPHLIHEEIQRHLTFARAAVKLAGDEPVLAGTLALLEATAFADLARANPKKHSHDDALAKVGEARALFDRIGDAPRVSRAALLEIAIYLARGADRDLGKAAFVAQSVADALAKAKLPRSPELDRVRAQLALARGEVKEAHELFDLEAGLVVAPRTGTPVEGVVLDADGKPAGGATVVAWTGELHGDRERLYTDPRALRGVVTETAGDGRFSIDADVRAIIAQRGDLRSAPQRAHGKSLALQLAPTTEVTGKVDAPRAFGADAFARFSLGTDAWFLHAPVEDLGFRLRRVPRGTPLYGTIGPAGTGTRRIVAAAAAKLAWPAGTVLDVVVRAPAFGDGATLWVFRDRPSPKTRAELDVFAASSTDVTIAPLVRIGSLTTDAGRALYAAGDRHAIVLGSGDFGGACIATTASPDAAIACAPLVKGVPAILVEVTP